ncbi:hypothetical protein SAY87_019192 [Trapa incisa]|uniref:Germin-like protein n=1 Tax=Trapa incisa TaxID=236973 RepID=A0AAN7Q1M3_9MYRT|nr:hypothetical protein SAY87_019192 [Trapa incisa]
MALQSLALLFFLLLVCSSSALVQDFCVADRSLPQTAAGFACKSLNKVTIDDFTFSGLDKPGNKSALAKVSFNAFTVDEIPGLNGLGLTLGRIDMDPKSAFPMHSHPGTTEAVLMVQGTVTAGFISSTANTVYSKTLNPGDAIVMPAGLLHFVVNSGNKPASAYVFLNSELPPIQATSLALFQNDLPTDVVQATTFLDAQQIKKLKAVFGGTN